MSGINIFIGTCNLACAGLVVALAVPLIRGKVGMNPLYGVRFRRSFESDELWYEINRYGGRRLIQWSVVLAAVGVVSLFVPLEDNVPLILVLAMAPLLYVIPCVQSYRYASRLPGHPR